MTRKPNPIAEDIARDVLNQLSILRVDRGRYISGPYEYVEPEPSGTMHDHEVYLYERCTVCALGACLLSYVRMHDDVPIQRILAARPQSPLKSARWSIEAASIDVIWELRKVFNQEQLDLIESAFERFDMSVHQTNVNAAISFGMHYAKDKDGWPTHEHAVLAAIMRNILEHRGHFVPEDIHNQEGAKS